MKNAFWKADWFLGLVIAIALFGFAKMSGFIPGLERWAYDLGVNPGRRGTALSAQLGAGRQAGHQTEGNRP